MQIHRRHPWNLSPAEAIALQKELRTEVISDRPIDLDGVDLVAGVDVSVKNEQVSYRSHEPAFPDAAEAGRYGCESGGSGIGPLDVASPVITRRR